MDENDSMDGLFTQAELEADFKMAVDMFEFALDEKGKDMPNDNKDNVLERFKNSEYHSAKRLRGFGA